MSKVQVLFNPKFVDGQADHVLQGINGTVMFTPEMKQENFIAQCKLVEDVNVVIFSKFFTVGCGLYPEWDWNTNLPIFPVKNRTIEETNKCLIAHIAFVRNKVTGQLMSLCHGGEVWSESECEIYVWKPGEDKEVFKDEEDEVLNIDKCYKVEYKHFVKCINALRKVAKALEKDKKAGSN